METDKKRPRYQRQIMLPEVGLQGQEILENSKILMIGVGGLGSSAAFYLAAAGIGCIGIVDDDVVEKSNLNRQILHAPNTIGQQKVDSAKKTLTQFNPDITIKTYPLRFKSDKRFEKLINTYDLILDCTDNFDTRYAINQACMNRQKTWIYGAVSEFEGQVMTIVPHKTPCYRCLYPAAPAPSQEKAATLGVTPGLVGILQASQALKYLLNAGDCLAGKLLFIDLLDLHFDIMSVTRNKTCPVCQGVCMGSNSEFSSTTLVYIISLSIIFGANPVAVKISLAGLGPFTNAGIRFSIAAVILFFWARWTHRPLKIKKHLWPSTIIVGLILTAQISLFYFAMTRTTASHCAIIANLHPFIVLILSHFFIPGDDITLKRIVGMLLGFAGILLILTDTNGIQSNFQTGDLILLAAVIMWACRVVFSKRIILNFEPHHLVIYPFVFSAPIFLIGGVLFDPVMIIRIDSAVILSLLFQSIVIASFGFVAWFSLLKEYGASSLHSFGFIMPIAGVFFSWIILEEPLTPHLISSLTLVTLGLMIFHARWPATG